MNPRYSEIIELVQKEVKPALGCTEPIAVALAVAKAAEILEERNSINDRLGKDFRIEVQVSANILKNGMGVGIPGTGMVGLFIAAALGAVCGKSEYGLEVLQDLSETSITRAKELVSGKHIKISLAETDKKLFIKAIVSSEQDGIHKAIAIVEDDHDNIAETWYDSIQISSEHRQSVESTQKNTLDYRLTVREIFDFAQEVPYKDIEFILESRTLNQALAEEGLTGKYGLKVGWAINLESSK